MTIREVASCVNARVLTPELDLETDVHAACGSDMMSDVLAYVKDQGMLITGLNNPQVVRTAEMMDMVCICFVRGKVPDETLLNLAREKDIVVMTSAMTLFTACGLLFGAGLRGGTSGD
jgi:predicted transcriptional regulator